MLPATGKGERRNLRGSARLSSKMSGRQPRLRALRPRPQKQQRTRTNAAAATTTAITEAARCSAENNLKEIAHEVTVKKRDAKAATNAIVSEMDVDDEQTATAAGNEEAREKTMTACADVAGNRFVEAIDLELVKRPSYECKSCNPSKMLPNIKAYAEHLRTEHKYDKGKDGQCPAENRCPTCSYVALNVYDLENHQRAHHLKRRYFRCEKCSYVTHIRARYTKHVKYHSMPMIKCGACDFRTPYKWNLDRHTRNHANAGSFQCSACDFTADIRQSLTVHEINHHDPPVGQISRKSNNSFERKPRNSPKRYNQVGASDFREKLSKSGSTITSTSSGDSYISDQSVILVEDNRSARANAECIALKCEEKDCQFITAWDSEMQRHLAEYHAPVSQLKSRKPLPMLIPLSPANSKPNNALSSGPPTTLLKVPRVRVRPELAQIARDTELAKMYGNKETTNSKKGLSTAAGIFEKKNASFFDKLKEKLTTAINNGVSEVAVSNTNDLKCWCTFKASSMEELACHKQTHHTALSVSVGTTRCPKCRRRCKSTTDLHVHMQCCHLRNDTSTDSNLEKVNRSGIRMTSYRGEYAFPSQVDWDANLRGLNSSGSSVEGDPAHLSGRRVFKCPHCPFWASTASRFHVHIVGHLNRKPFECSMCAYRSNWRWDITKHIKLKAAKDTVHTTARVLMTDETGRRNYSKYNKYLAQVEQQSWDEDHMEERSVEETSPNELKEMLFLNNKDDIPTASQTLSSVTIVPADGNQNNHNVDPNLRPPPPLKAATIRSRGQSLLKNNPITMHVHNGSSGGIVSITTTASTDESKRTQWKCKRCNYRDSNKDNVLLHVKSHYESTDQELTEERNPFGCGDCPFSAPDAATLSLHRMHHRPNLEAIFKCYLCPYYVSTKAELLDHARLHGEELATVHQQNVDFQSKSKYKQVSDGDVSQSKDIETMEQVIQITTRNNVVSNLSKDTATSPPSPSSLLLDTRAFPDAPLVWVSRLNGTLTKMLKCRHCPFVSSRRVEVEDHETMHVDIPSHGPLIACTDCSFTCTRRDIMIAHTEVHTGSLGTVHCLVDETRPDSQQLTDLANLLGLSRIPALGTEPDLEDSRLVHCCSKCPARFLCDKELRIHLRYHSTMLAYLCRWCSYGARQTTHLLAHHKAHSTEYQERTKYLLSLYGHSQRYPPPVTACIEAEHQVGEDTLNIAWIVVDPNDNTNNTYSSSSSGGVTSSVQRTGNQVFTCAKCPARYFKLDALEYHMTLHGSNNRFKCNDCDYSSKTAQNLMKHQVVHRRHNEASEITTSASATTPATSPSPDSQVSIFMRGNPNFIYPGSLRNGRLKEKRYKCLKCPSAFEKREQYRVHLSLHGAKQRYRCGMCDYSVKYYANYVQHLRKHQANAEAQASRRRYEDDRISVDSDSASDTFAKSALRSSKSLRSSGVGASPVASSTLAGNAYNIGSNNNVVLQSSNQDKQSLLLMQKKGIIPVTGNELETIRCQSCPFSTTDKDAMDTHKRRHGIERMTPSCPHCDYIPRKDENIGEHIKLHFTRLYKPESYLIVELLTLTMEKMPMNAKEEKQQRAKELLFKECADGRFLPFMESTHPLPLDIPISTMSTRKEKVIVDPNTGETKHRLAS